jgi:hypothetical protein
VCNSTAVLSKSFKRQKQLSWHVSVCQSVTAGRLSTWSIPTRWAQKTIAGGQEAPAWVAAHFNQLSYQLCLCLPLHFRCILASHYESQHYFWSLPAFLTLLPLQVTLLVSQLLALTPFAVQLWRALSKQLDTLPAGKAVLHVHRLFHPAFIVSQTRTTHLYHWQIDRVAGLLLCIEASPVVREPASSRQD